MSSPTKRKGLRQRILHLPCPALFNHLRLSSISNMGASRKTLLQAVSSWKLVQKARSPPCPMRSGLLLSSWIHRMHSLPSRLNVSLHCIKTLRLLDGLLSRRDGPNVLQKMSSRLNVLGSIISTGRMFEQSAHGHHASSVHRLPTRLRLSDSEI